jgi:predicted RNA methylase
VQPGEVVLEPSAGIGGLAVYAKNSGAKVVVNELSKRRLELIKEMGFDQVYNEDAEQIDNILPDSVKPTVVIMNPPFSSTAGRMEGKRDTKFSTKHIEQALNRLEPNGRLVMIVGRGMADDAASFKDWWKKIKQEYNVRLNIGIDGSNYKKYGTSFDVQLIVIDKTGPTTEPTATSKLTNLEDVLPFLEVVRNDRIRPTEQTGDKRAGQGNAEDGRSRSGPEPIAPIPTGGVGTGDRTGENRGRNESKRDNRPTGRGGNAPVSGRTEEGNGLPSRGGEPVPGTESVSEVEKTPGSSSAPVRQTEGSADRGGLSKPESGIKVESQEPAPVQGEELSEAVYAAYTPQKLKIPGAQKHPGNLEQSAAMAAVEPPEPTYTPNLPGEVIKNGKLSIAQLESIVYAGQSHEQTLPDGQRRGFFIGDGTGVGKGREISGIILDNMRQ